MKRFTLIFSVLVTLTLISSPAKAADRYYDWFAGSRHHVVDHHDFNHRAVDRAIRHDVAHAYGLTSRRQHRRLHSRLNHEAFHDRVEHAVNHRSGAYWPRHGYGHAGYGLHGNGWSVWFGH